nr:integrase, catalytic region, zinc finger, CCHC-type, peptidase aspartic, catalytic [Tanacetum cinerariifolium]
MIATPGEPDHHVPVPESFHEQTDEELTENDLKRMDADDQAIQTTLLGLLEDVYAVEKFTSTNGESIESYYHRFMQLMNYLKRNKHFPENIASNLKFLNNLQPKWKIHVTIVRHSKNLHEADFTQIYDFLKMNQEKNQQGYNAWQNGGIQGAKNVGQNAGVQSGGNQNRLVVVPGITNQNETGNVVAAKAEGDLNEIEEVNANCILMANLQHASISGTQLDKAPVYDTDGSAEVQHNDNCYDNEIFNMFTQEEQYMDLLEPIPEPQLVPQNDNHVTSVATSMVQSEGTVKTSSAPNEETRAHQETIYRNLVDQVAKEKEYAVLWNNWYTKCEECKYDKFSYDKAYNDMQQKAKRLQAQLRDLKGKSSNTPSASNTLDLLNQKLESKIIELEFQVVNYERTSETPHVDKPKFSVVTPHSKKLHASMPSHSVPQPREFNVVKRRNVIALEMFKINPPQTPRENVSSNTVTASSTRLVHIVRTKRPQPKGNTRNVRVPSASKSSEVKKNVTVEDHRRTLLLSKNKKHVILMVYFVKGLGHNLFLVGQFEVAFRRNTCFIRDLDGVDLLKGNHSTNLYTINLYDMASASPICLMARATPTKS